MEWSLSHRSVVNGQTANGQRPQRAETSASARRDRSSASSPVADAGITLNRPAGGAARRLSLTIDH
jgi:hypothetical protein